MLQVFHLNIAKVDLDVAYVCNDFQVFLGVFASVSDVRRKSFRPMLNVAKVDLMLHML
jgi:hypothetical protein